MLEGQTDFESALRQNEVLLEETSVPIQDGAESQAVAIPTTPVTKVPALDPDRELIWTVDDCSVRFHLVELLAKPAVALGTALDSSNAIVLWVDSTLCLLARSTDSEFMFSADAPGAYSVEITVSSIDLEPWARRSKHAEKIPAGKLPPLGLLQSQVDARIEALDHPVDSAGEQEFTLAAISGGGLGVANLGLQVIADGVTYTIGLVVRDASRIAIYVTPIASVAKLRPYHVKIGETRLAFAEARVNPGDAHNPDIYEWIGGYPSWGAAGGKVTLTIYEPIGPENFVPGGRNADNGKVLKRTAAGPVWGNAIAPTEERTYTYDLTNTNWADTELSIPATGKEWLLLSLQNFRVPAGEIIAYSNEVFVRITDLLTDTNPSTRYAVNTGVESNNTYHGVSINFAGESRSSAGDLHFGATSAGNLLIASHYGSQQGTLRVRAL